MKVSEKARAALEELEELWKNPEKLVGVVALTAVKYPDDRPLARWSIYNRILCALRGTRDARTFKQWKAVDRSIIRGRRAIYILAPIIIKSKDEEEDDDRMHLVGFRGVPVFRVEDTDGSPVDIFTPPPPPPLADVAEAWGIPVHYAEHSGGESGHYSITNDAIILRVEEPEVYFHELCTPQTTAHTGFTEDKTPTRRPWQRSAPQS